MQADFKGVLIGLKYLYKWCCPIKCIIVLFLNASLPDFFFALYKGKRIQGYIIQDEKKTNWCLKMILKWCLSDILPKCD